MEVYRGLEEVKYNPKHIITVGTFDGVHRGHQKIIKRMQEISKINGGETLLVTFDPHPQFIVKRPEKEPIKLLTTIDERLKLFQKFGLDKVLIIPFTKGFAETTGDVFIKQILHEKIGFSHILVGHDHYFGKNREGNYEMLVKWSQLLNFIVEQIPAYIIDEITISSTKIRNALSQNQIKFANKLLGYYYFIDGTVVAGDGRGNSLGFPTANIKFDIEHKLVPSNGVYFVFSLIEDKKFFGMANLGFRPTFRIDKKKTLEVHFLNFSGDLYGKTLTVFFLDFLRDEKKFYSVDDLLIQLKKDKEYANNLIGSLGLEKNFLIL
ncbi:MAG: bifunctional riboflavin kinase/FAD synthetase [Candidatus Kapaibacteriota bacterium]